MEKCDPESKAMWEAIRKLGKESVISDLLRVGSIEPMPEAEGECCRSHREIISRINRFVGNDEYRKRFKFCPECGRRSL